MNLNPMNRSVLTKLDARRLLSAIHGRRVLWDADRITNETRTRY